MSAIANLSVLTDHQLAITAPKGSSNQRLPTFQTSVGDHWLMQSLHRPILMLRYISPNAVFLNLFNVLGWHWSNAVWISAWSPLWFCYFAAQIYRINPWWSYENEENLNLQMWETFSFAASGSMSHVIPRLDILWLSSVRHLYWKWGRNLLKKWTLS